MAVRQGNLYEADDGTATAVWIGITEADSGSAVVMAKYPDKTVQAVGDFTTAGAITMEGSNDGDSWGVLTDNQGNDIVLTDDTPVFIAQNTKYIRPVATAGTSVDMDVYVYGVK